MCLDEYIKLLEEMNYNSKLTLECEQAIQLLRYLKELRGYRQNPIEPSISPIYPVRENPLSSPNRYCPTLWYW